MKDPGESRKGDDPKYSTGSEQDLDKWRRFASDLGMELRPGYAAFLETPRLLRLGGLAGRTMPPDAEKFRRSIENPVLCRYFEGFPGIVSGKRGGCAFHIYRTSEKAGHRSSRQIVLILLLFEHPYDYGMRITRAVFPGSILRKFTDRMHIGVPGSRELNRLLVVRGRNRKQIGVHLSDEGTRSALLELFGSGERYEICDDGIRLVLPGRLVEADTAVLHMGKMARAAAGFF